MTRSSDDRSRFLQILADTPFLFHACKKAGISRSAVYRWMKSNPEFKKTVNKMLDEGRTNMAEIGEIALMKKVQQGETGAIKFLLTHNSKRYMPKKPEKPKTELSAEHLELYRDMFRWYMERQGMTIRHMSLVQKAMQANGFLDENMQITQKFRNEFPDVMQVIEEVPADKIKHLDK